MSRNARNGFSRLVTLSTILNVWLTEQLEELQLLIEAQGETEEHILMRDEMHGEVAKEDKQINKLRTEVTRLEEQLPQASKPDTPKFDPEKHPLLRKTLEKQEPEKVVAFSTGDICEAQWTDKSWYKVKVQSVLGSASAPKYLVRFIEYGDTLTVDRTAIRPLPNKRKQNIDVAPAAQSVTPTASSPHVISGPASVNPGVQAAKNAANGAEEPAKPSRVPTKGALKKRQSNWNDWQTKLNKKGVTKKESMFRTSTEAGSRGISCTDQKSVPPTNT